MQLLNYTHPGYISALPGSVNCASEQYYTLLQDAPRDAKYYHPNWALFRFSVLMEAGSAWVHAQAIDETASRQLLQQGWLKHETAIVVGSGEPPYDDALACALQCLGWTVKIAENWA